jgi:hypothetical protein
MNVVRSRELLEGDDVFRAGPDGSLFVNIASECNLFAYLKKSNRQSDADCFASHENGVKLAHELLHGCPQHRMSTTIFLAFSLPSMTKLLFLH